MKILNLYSGIGGNRKLWGDQHQVTAVENDPATAEVYRKLFPKDRVVVADAHQFLKENYQDYDFIWASPPCPSHSRMRMLGVAAGQIQPIYPDFKLYEEIIFLQKFAKPKTKWVVENVIPYYDEFIEPTIKIDRHLYWSNFEITPFESTNKPSTGIRQVKSDDKRFGFSIKNSNIKKKDKALRNLVDPQTGEHILNCAMNGKRIVQKKNPMSKKLTTHENELSGLAGTVVAKSELEKLAIKAGERGNHELELRCIGALCNIKGDKVKIDSVAPFTDIPNSELQGLADELTESLNGDDGGQKLSSDQYYRELAQSLLKHIKSGNVQRIESYVKPKGKTIESVQTQNGVTGNIYEGMMNKLNLAYYPLPFFATLNNIKQKKGKLKKGAKFSWVYFQRVVLKYDKQNTTWEEIKKLQKSGKFDAKKYEHYSVFKKYRVYNFMHIEGEFFEKKIEGFRHLIEEFEKDFPKPPKRIDIFLNSLSKLTIKKGMKPPAFYSPGEDYISMPPLSFFATKNRYFQTLFHELGHWTGHHSRLDRLTGGKFGSEPYAKEELVAELTGYFLVNEFRLMEDLIKEKAANYLKGWGTTIKKDKAKKIVWAYKKAMEASEYVLKRNDKGIPFYVRELAKQKKPSTRKKTAKSTKKSVKGKKDTTQTALALSGLGDLFTPANVRKPSTADTFRLNGEIGKFLQDLQRFRLAIVLTGDPHAGKSEFVKQLVDAFLAKGFTCGYFDLEQGGLPSKDTTQSIDRNISSKHQNRLLVAGEAPNGIETIKKYANKFDVVVVDSWQKLDIPNKRFDELRKEFPDTIFTIIFQQNGEGGTRGGVTVDYDTPIAIKVHKVDETFKNNYAELLKNRENSIGLKYNISRKKLI